MQLLGRVGREPKEVNLANADVKFTAFPLVTSLRVKRPDDEARPEGGMCVCVCVCVRARACVCHPLPRAKHSF